MNASVKKLFRYRELASRKQQQQLNVTSDSAVFKLLSDSSQRIEQAKKALDEIAARETESKEFEDQDYLTSSNNDLIEKIQQVCLKSNVKFKWNLSLNKIKVNIQLVV